MANRRRRRKQKSAFTDVITLITSIAMIVIAVLLMVFVYFYIKNNSFLDSLPFFGTQAETETETDSQAETEETGGGEESTAAGISESYDGLTRLEDGSLIYVIREDEMSRFDPECVLQYEGDHKILASSWYESGEYLYYFGSDGKAVSELNEGAMHFTFDRDHILDGISYNRNYNGDAGDESADFPGLVRGKTLWAFLDEDKTAGELYAIRFKKTTDSLTHELGGGSNPQYTSRYAMAVSEGYIYYLAVSDSQDKIIEPIAGKLFRMKPGSEFREIAAENVKGYKIMETGDGHVKIYYDDGSGIHCTNSFKQDDSLRIFPEDASYYVETSSGKAVLMLEGGYPVTLESEAFTAGNFIYSINGLGEIRSVASKSKVSIGGYTYTVENGEAFGARKARVIRQDSAGTVEVISAEFDGSVRNIHYDFGTGRMIAEYNDATGAAGLISISKDGDVDQLIDASNLGGTAELYAIQNGDAIIKTGRSDTPFKKVRISATYPITLGIDPIVLETDDPGEETQPETTGPGQDTVQETAQTLPTRPGPGDEITAAAPESSAQEAETAAPTEAPTEAPQTEAAQAGPAEVVAGGPGGEVIETSPQPVEQKGPGEP